MDRNQMAYLKSISKADSEKLFAEVLVPLVQALNVIERRVVWLETPFYRRWWLKASHPIGLWFARRRPLRLEAKAKPAKDIAELQEPVVQSEGVPNTTN